MSSSSAIPPKQFWVGVQGFRDTSDLTLFKKRKGIAQVRNEPVIPSTLQSLQNRTSYQFNYLDCPGCASGFSPIRLTPSTPI